MIFGILENGINIIMVIMKTSTYTVVPIHQRPDLFVDCCKLINSEWPSSETRRLRTLSMSCENFPTCLILLNGEKVVGHCKISLISSLNESCLIESVVIDTSCRFQGLGSMLLRGAEEYVACKGMKSIYLCTKGQEKFYLKNGYSICEPISIWNCGIPATFSTTIKNNNFIKKEQFSGPPPPPLPKKTRIPISTVVTSKTYLVKRL